MEDHQQCWIKKSLGRSPLAFFEVEISVFIFALGKIRATQIYFFT